MRKLIVGLAGNPNVGKTTVFNRLTGMRQHVGNWPGKTVESAMGHFTHGEYEYELVDLPGNYALSAHTIEEIVSRDFIVDDDSDVIVNVVDAANLERNLYLTVQMMELGANLILALNMNDFAKKKDYIINIDLMSELLGFPVIDINAKTGDGIEELLNAVERQAAHPIDSSEKLVYGNDLKGHLSEIQDYIERDNDLLDVPSVWTAVKLLEKDTIVIDKVQHSKNGSRIMIVHKIQGVRINLSHKATDKGIVQSILIHSRSLKGNAPFIKRILYRKEWRFFYIANHTANISIVHLRIGHSFHTTQVHNGIDNDRHGIITDIK